MRSDGCMQISSALQALASRYTAVCIPSSELTMGLDGGTYITRSDILRGQSWAMATADNSRSTRGGNASTSSAQKKVDDHTARCLAAAIVNYEMLTGYLLASQRF